MLTALITNIVDLSRRFAWAVVVLSLLLATGSSWYAAMHFSMNTDVNQLLSKDLIWRKQEAELEKAFPQKVDIMLVVVEGETADAAETAAVTLTAKLQAMPERFSYVARPDTIPFFLKNGLLFLSDDELTNALNQLVQAQPLLGMLSNDPSLRGFFNTIGLMVMGIKQGAADYKNFDQPFSKIAETVEAALLSKDKPLSWQSMAPDYKPTLRDLRKFIITKPVLDYSNLQPGQAASDAVRQLVQELNLPVRVRLTGPVPLNDEEFASVAEGTGSATIVSAVLVFVLLLIALRSLKIVLPILLTLTVGLAATTAFALAAIGSLNLISVAFAVMFIGIAVDFGIQFGVRYRDQRYQEPDVTKALTRTASIIAIPLAMAAASTALGFLTFIPTDYRGVSELGLIAGAGMIIAFILNITLLPALLAIVKPPAEPEAIGYRWMAPLDRFLVKRRIIILALAAGIAMSGLTVASQLRFDFDPLNLKDPNTESVSTLFDLMQDPDFNTYTIEILRPSLAEAQTLADQIGKLPQVDHVMTLASFVPGNQEAKLAMIADTSMLLDATLNLPPVEKAPDDKENRDVIRKTAEELRTIGKDHASAEKLAIAMEAAAMKTDPDFLPRLHQNLIGAMQGKLDMIKGALKPTLIDVNAISDDLKRDWVSADGRFLIQVYPKGNPRDHDTLIAFTEAVRQMAPDASGAPVSIQESGRTVTKAFIQAGIYAIIAITLLAFLILRNLRDVIILLAPLILAGILTLATIVLIGLPLNFANIIALPLLLSLGVSYAIYFVSYWRAGMSGPLQSSMARAVLFSAATVLVAFGSLALSSHPGTAGMGKLLTVALLYSLSCTFLILPALCAFSTSPPGE